MKPKSRDIKQNESDYFRNCVFLHLYVVIKDTCSRKVDELLVFSIVCDRHQYRLFAIMHSGEVI